MDLRKRKTEKGEYTLEKYHGSTRTWSASSRRRSYESLRILVFIGRRMAQTPQAPSRWMTRCGRAGAQGPTT